MKVIQPFPLSQIHIDRLPLNPRTLALVDFLRAGGRVPPIQIVRITYRKPMGVYSLEVPYGSKAYKIKDGRHRWLAYKLLGRAMIPAERAVNTAVVRTKGVWHEQLAQLPKHL